MVTDGDTMAVELGVKFRASTSGEVVGLRFYKGPQNTGAHSGHLWTSTGTLLGTLTFANETASGWQEARFASPIAITAGTTYVASYLAPAGHYSADANYFASDHASGILTAPSSASSGGNGVYNYGSTPAFPNQTYNATNYWVDVIVSAQQAPADTQSPSIPANLTATAVSSSQINLAWTASPDNVGVSGYRLERCTGSSCNNFAQVAAPSGTSYPDTGLAANLTYRYRVRATDAAGNLSGYSSIASAITGGSGGGAGDYYLTPPTGCLRA